MADLNLSEWEQALREERGEGPTVEYGGRTWQLPVLLPWSLIEIEQGMVDGAGAQTRTDRALYRAARDLLGDAYADFAAMSPSAATVVYFIDTAHQAYVPTPKSEGSSESSTPASTKPKRPTKRPTTGT